MKNGFVLIKEERTTQKMTKVGSLMKRLVSNVATKEKDRANDPMESRRWPKWRRTSERRPSDCSRETQQQQHPMPEILRVSPKLTSCEVTLISSADDSPVEHPNTATQDGKAELDNSYHMVLNPHRRSRTKYYEEDDGDKQCDVADHGTTEFTNDSTADLSYSLDLNAQEKTAVESFFAGRDYEELDFTREIDDDTDGVANDHQQNRYEYDFMAQRHTMHYKSLFVDSDSDFDDDFSEREDREFWENYERSGCDRDHGDDAPTNEKQQALNTTIDTSPIEYGDDDSSVSSRDEDLPLEITVHIDSDL
eukprot:CAMPEP_0197184606 /NCGR_PEP_ID=MMETSP1423-20130617/10191_1 /TAXON_ID=476441 /ORGANISM="Pseudo-nitzschia heimii, Strain UNC1101" /LENGTH=306 /DNA_ID=CAMNT_0042635459 /DNA_START=169 /DNA_END=1089 /DNA_ORIENTATION=+